MPRRARALALALALLGPLGPACVANPTPLGDDSSPAPPPAPAEPVADGRPSGEAAALSDEDDDGVGDEDDACPAQPELINGVDDGDGCPDVGPLGVQLASGGARLAFDGAIHFRTNDGAVLPESEALVKLLAQTLRDNPHLGVIRVEVHSDSRGTAEYNLQLTKDRAKALREALIERGVAPERLRAVGMGESTPLHCENGEPPHCSRRVELWLESAAPERAALTPTQGD